MLSDNRFQLMKNITTFKIQCIHGIMKLAGGDRSRDMHRGKQCFFFFTPHLELYIYIEL
jgi:hypothetical protein